MVDFALLRGVQVAGTQTSGLSFQPWGCFDKALRGLKHSWPLSFRISEYIISCLVIVFQNTLDWLYFFNMCSASLCLVFFGRFRLEWYGLSLYLTDWLVWIRYLLCRVNRLWFIELRRFRFLAPYAEHGRFWDLLPLWRRRIPFNLFRHLILLAFLWWRIDFDGHCLRWLFLTSPWNRDQPKVSSLRIHHPLHWPLRTSIHGYAILEPSDLLLYGRIWGRWCVGAIHRSFTAELGTPLRPLRLDVIRAL